MADNYLECRLEDYERLKSKLVLRKKNVTKAKRNIEKPEDEAL